MPSLRDARRERSQHVEVAVADTQVEERSSLTSWPSGFGIMDPAAIPPPGMGVMQRAGVPVTPHTPLALDTPLLTTDGWKTIGTVEVGDTVFAEDGSPTDVVALSPVYADKECYELDFADGSSVISSHDHSWKVWDAHASKTRTQSGRAWSRLTTEEIVSRYQSKTGQFRYRVACDAVPQTQEVDLPIDPYILGYWIGDGNKSGPTITVGDEDKQHLVNSIKSAGYKIVNSWRVRTEWGRGWRILFSTGRKGDLTRALRSLGVLYNKHIPELYLSAAPEQRHALLAGLLDSDGSISTGKQTSIDFSQASDHYPEVSKRVLEGTHRLARSLGIRTRIAGRNMTWTPTFDPFRMTRKSARFGQRADYSSSGRRSERMSITGARRVSTVPTRCITIAHDSHVFLVGRTFVPTGNSLQVDAVFTSLRIICNSIIDLGNLRAYETQLSPDNIPYREWMETQPGILESTWGPDMFQYDGRERTIISMAIFNEAFWHVLDRDNLGYPSALEVLHPSFMKIEVEGGRKVYEYGTPANRQVIPREDVIHIPKMSMPGATRSLSGIEYGGVIFAVALAAMEYGQRWFAQGASPGYILTTKNRLNPTDVTRIGEKFLFEHSGLANSHLPLILDNGMEISKVQSSPDEAQFLQTLEYARSAIFDWFGIPSFLRLNALERAAPEPPGVIQERATAFLRFTLSGFITPLQEAHSVTVPQSMNAAFDTAKFVEPDAKSLSQEIMVLRNTQVASVNDIRTRKLGWSPSSEPDADKVILPLASNVSPQQTHDPEKDPANEPDDER